MKIEESLPSTDEGDIGVSASLNSLHSLNSLNSTEAQPTTTEAPKKQLTPELLDLKKAIKRGAYNTLQGEVSATKLVETAKPTMDTLVAPLLPRVGIVSLVGSSDSGKSSLLRGLALAVASGAEEWLSLPLRTHHQSALYISTEDDEDAIATLLHK
ncbi:MAG: AAA family ATPase, partial [Tidjanibacter sp.]|nr:AAA family ATPase [Tidjanibacter sp.]